MATPRAAVAPRMLTSFGLVFDAVTSSPASAQASGATATDYGAGCSHFQLTPSQSTSTFRGATPADTWTGISAATWTATLTLATDFDTSAGLANYLLANAGQTRAVDFTPNGGRTVRAFLILAVPPIGGDVDAWLTGQITCGVQGAPTFTTAGS